MKNIILADKAGFCFGVKRAVDMAIESQEKYGKKVYTLGPLIHNNDVINYLKDKNIFPIKLEEIHKLNEGDIIIIRSHGVPLDVIENLKKKNLIVVDATCPYVGSIHQKVKQYSEDNYQVVIVGDKNHPEVQGINGWCNNNALIIKDDIDTNLISSKVCVVSQTTEKQETWEKALDIVIENSKEIAAFNTICSATHIRQKAAEELSKKIDMMIVVGGHHSSNTTKLYEICKKNCSNTIHIENAKEIPNEVVVDEKIVNVGITAGASTPDWIIKEVIDKMQNNTIEIDQNVQMEFMNNNNFNIAVGDTLDGKIISVNEKELFINIGYKTDAILPKNEMVLDEDVDLTQIFKKGESVKAKVLSRQNSDGFVVLSQIELEREKALKEIEELCNLKTSLDIKVKDVVKGGLVGFYKNIRIFIPASHIDIHHVPHLESYINKTLQVKIIEFVNDRKNSKIVASHKEILKEELQKLQKETWTNLQNGQIVEGEVRRLTNFGAFVEVGGIDGLLHISEISWKKLNKPSDVLKIGDKVKTLVLNVDKEKGKLSLSIKKLIEDPWKNVQEKYPIGNIVLGKIVRLTNFGAFVELEPGVDGLVHVSKISHNRIEKPSDILEIGENVKAKIIDVEAEEKRIALSIKEVNNY
ncbi:bifunctional 4-hydroxy-3-methylbut-2-enyl diphosphate reductase/30S ribosomal protein S1 [Haloimpatiens sp. FM7330]|uniref:bifunctional 4-hydroxy-3-methylbut-2-enyl diphosphate reductase/30S ribosomal protein S1 n=1 Tax=Haloimpatiens sp. FM7330 TaxID=3298610 RepID=UPI00363BEA59